MSNQWNYKIMKPQYEMKVIRREEKGKPIRGVNRC